MSVQEQSPAGTVFGPAGCERAGVAEAEVLGPSLEVFRGYLTLLARRALGSDMAAKMDASDLVQETFLAAGRDIAQFKGCGPEGLRCWLRGIMQHLMANTRRRYRNTRKRQLCREMQISRAGREDVRDPVATISSSATSPSGRAMRRERADALREGLLCLPEHYRQVIQWHHQERLPFEVIAERLGVSPEAARKVWGRALLRLRATLGPGHDPR